LCKSLFAAILSLAVCEAEAGDPTLTGTPIVTPLPTQVPTPRGEISPMKDKVPQGILDPILNKAAALANLAHCGLQFAQMKE
jgi:hypothetical protein